MQTEFEIATRGPGLYEFTGEVAGWLRAGGAEEGVLTLFIRHTSASLLVQENADPAVRDDLATYFDRRVPPVTDPGMAWVTHRQEGPDDMPAHIKAAMLPVSLAIPVAGGRMRLGTWQGVFVFEHRDAPRTRRVAAHLRPG